MTVDTDDIIDAVADGKFSDLESDYSPDSLFQDEVNEYGGDREYEYPLTAFVPKAPTPAGTRTIPAEAAYWIIPDLQDVVLVRLVKAMSTTYFTKVPASYNELYLRVNKGNQPDPTQFQAAVWSAVLTKYPDKNGKAPASQMYMLPVLRRYNGEWAPAIGELSVTAYRELQKAAAEADDLSDGRIGFKTHPVAIWKPALKEVTARFDRSFNGTGSESVQGMLGKFREDMLRPRDYILLRSRLTEKWHREQWAKFTNGETVAVAEDSLTDQEKFVEEVMELGTPVLKRILSDCNISIGGARTKIALADLVINNREATEGAVKSLQDPPF